jgi:hypothetical protein
MKKSELKQIIQEEIQNVLNEGTDPIQQGCDDAMEKAGVKPYSGPKSNSMKEKKYTVAFDYRYRDDLDFDSIDVMAKSEEEAVKKAQQIIQSKRIAAIWKTFHVV